MLTLKLVQKKNDKRFAKGLYRTYQNGYSTKGWIKGQRIENIQQIFAGDVLIVVNHKLQTENLVVVHKPFPNANPRLFFYNYVRPTLRQIKGKDTTGAWDSDLKFVEFHRAVNNKKIAA